MNKIDYLELIQPAIDIVVKKHEDYNNESLGLKNYFPFGDQSYVQMLHVKSQRLVGLTQSGAVANFESVNDTVLDLINYAVFYLKFLKDEQNAKTK